MEKLITKALPVFTGSKTNITFEVESSFLDIAKIYYQKYKKQLQEGKYWKLTLEKYDPARTLKQNALWHLMIRRIAQKTFNSFEMTKQGIKELAVEEYGYSYVVNPISGKVYPKPSSEATVMEMAILFNVTFLVGAEENTDLSEFYEDVKNWRTKNDNNI